MNERLNSIWQEYQEVLNSQIFKESDLDYSILKKHITQLNRLNKLESGAYSIFDLFKHEHAYHSKKYETIFGYDIKRAEEEGVAYSNQRIHPDDFLALNEAGIYFLKLGFTVSHEKRRKYKLVNEYRLNIGKETWRRVIEQHFPLESDKKGNIWLSLSILDLSPDQDLTLPCRSRLINYYTGEVFLFPPEDTEIINKPLLSIREKEILDLIAEGLVSKQIADKLFISINTVNTHRQRIIEKLGVNNTFGAIRIAASAGLI